MTGIRTASARGREHAANQDAFRAWRRGDLQVLAVADGVSGTGGGEIAAPLALRAFTDELQRRVSEGNLLVQAAEAAAQRAAADVEAAGGRMATTLTAVCVKDGQGALAHVGDSRAYLWRAGSLTVLTEDHSVATELVRTGALPPAGVERHHYRNVLTQAVGIPGVRPQVQALALQPGDVLLLCTDGVHKALPQQMLQDLLAEGGVDAAKRAVRTVVAHGSRDDATALAARFATGRRTGARWVALAAVLVLVIALMLAAAGTPYFLGLSGSRVALFRGFPLTIAGVPLHWTDRVYATTVWDLPADDRDRLAKGVPVHDGADALRVLQRMPRRSP